MRRLVLIPIFLVIGCGPHLIKTAAIVSLETSKAVMALQEKVKEYHDTGIINDAGYQVWKESFVKLSDVGIALDKALREGNDQKVIEQIKAGIGFLDFLIQNGIPKIPQDKQVLIMVLIESARSILVAIAAAHGGA